MRVPRTDKPTLLENSGKKKIMTTSTEQGIGVRLHAADNVVVATRDLSAGTGAGTLTVRQAVPRGH